jgi:EAL domain-containing protein (putative c-di-GMP-specific phosphodiesterase class I)
MVKAIKDVAETLGVYTVGEYVETEAIAERLSLIGVDYAQGYFFGRPLPLENELEKILTVKKTA